MNYTFQSPSNKQKDISKQSNHSPKIIGNYSIENTIGEGTFGKVKLATHILSKEKVAIKILNKNKIHDKEELSIVEKEIKYLKQLSNINIIKVYEVLETPSQYYLVMEYINGGDLFTYIINHTHLHEDEASYFFSQLIHGVKSMHEKKISHRDLKPENILLTEKKVLKIIDFGLSNEYEKYLSTTCGSANYSLPEMIRGMKYTGISADLWASGVILYAMICGYLPFDDVNNEKLFSKVLDGKVEFPNDNISLDCKDLITRMLTTNSSKRISLEEILRHPFLAYGNEKYQKLINNENCFNHNDIILDHMTNKMDFKRGEVLSSLDNDKHNNITTTFKLLKKQYIEGRFYDFHNKIQEDDNDNDDNETERDNIDIHLHKKTINTNLLNKNKKRVSTSTTTPHGHIFKGSITSNNSIMDDLDKIIMENSSINQSNLIPLYHPKIIITTKPIKINPLFNRLIRGKEAKLLNKKIDTSVSAEQVKRSNNTNSNTNVDESISTKAESYKQLKTKKKSFHTNRYQRNKMPSNNQLTNIYQTSLRKKEVNKAINDTAINNNLIQPGSKTIENDRVHHHINLRLKSQLMTYHQNTISAYNSNPIQLSKERKNPVPKIPQRQVNSLAVSTCQNSHIQSNNKNKSQINNEKKASSSIFMHEVTSRTSHHSPLKSILLNYPVGKTARSPVQKKDLLSELELNRIISSQQCSKSKNSHDNTNKKKNKHKDNNNTRNNRLLIIPKPKSANFALCTSKLPKNIIEKKLKDYCNQEHFKINLESSGEGIMQSSVSLSTSTSKEGGGLFNNCLKYIIEVNSKDKLVVEISTMDDLTMLKLYHFLGNESITKENIKKIIINVGF